MIPILIIGMDRPSNFNPSASYAMIFPYCILSLSNVVTYHTSKGCQMVLLKKAFSIHHPLGSPFGTPKGRCWVVMFCHCRGDEFPPCSELYADREASKPPPPPPVWKLRALAYDWAFEVLANKKRWFSYGFHDGKGSGDFVCHSSVTRKHPKAKSVRNHRQACSVCGHLGHEACGKSKPQKGQTV